MRLFHSALSIFRVIIIPNVNNFKKYLSINFNNFQELIRNFVNILGFDIRSRFQSQTQKQNVNQFDETDNTPLSRAIQCGNTEAVKLLLAQKEIDVNSDHLCIAIQISYIEAVKLLLACGRIDVNKPAIHGYTPLAMAIQCRNTEAVELLLAQKDIDVNSDHLCIAIQISSIAAVKLLLACGRIDVNKPAIHGYTPLAIAIQCGNTEAVELLLAQKDIDVKMVNTDKITPLGLALAKKSDCDIVNLVLKCYEQKSLLDICRTLHHAYTLLRTAIDSQNTALISWLLKYKEIDFNKRYDGSSKTPLDDAIMYNKTEVIKLFLECDRIDVNSDNSSYGTPLCTAIERSDIAVVKLLLECDRIDVNQPGFNGYTPLALATKLGRIEIVELLLQHEYIMVNKIVQLQYDTNASTALHLAAKYKKHGIYRLMLQDARFNVNIQNTKFKSASTPLELVLQSCIVPDDINLFIHSAGVNRLPIEDCLKKHHKRYSEDIIDVIARATFEKGLIIDKKELVVLGWNKCSAKQELLNSIHKEDESFRYISKTIIDGKSALDVNITNPELINNVRDLKKSAYQNIRILRECWEVGTNSADRFSN